MQLGSGRKARDGWISVDISPRHRPDLVADLANPWPFKADSVALYEIEHVLEHLADTEHFVCELFRTLKPGGEALVTVPHCNSPFATADPTHVRFFNGLSFDYFAVAGHRRRLSGTYEHELRLFELLRRQYRFGGFLGMPIWRLLGIDALATWFPVTFEKWFAWLPFGGCDITWLVRKPLSA